MRFMDIKDMQRLYPPFNGRTRQEAIAIAKYNFPFH